MSDGGALIDVGKLSKPAVVLIEKISDAIGGAFRPYQIKRVAKAEADAAKTRALAEIEITELQHRSLMRVLGEEEDRQRNIEHITAKAIQHLKPDATPDKLEKDWLTHFFDRSRIVSDEEMQSLWGQILAGEANKPGTFKRRTIELVSTIDKADANLFTSLCTYAWMIGAVTPIVFDLKDDVYKKHGITFDALTHLDDIGLVTFDSLAGFIQQGLPKRFAVHYYGRAVHVELPNEKDNKLEFGHVLLTKAGRELAPICGSKEDPEFLVYVKKIWESKGYKIDVPPA